ncbi:nucleotidyltransferase family protein [Halorubrum sp. BOL3-1]|uniref:type VII toxin-antitoxin system MntA family adenylyltransferase antitoxin n=1 Tax=Halorubrum sp. BOL3-1 TaxID=2497325 RepID=UPI00140A4F96|nr:nucleotidyltransferase domain-containing protein [Halorubrum sp. BOL3-1]
MVSDDADGNAIDGEAVRGVLQRYPIRLGILFGSQVTGKTHADSDVDVAVEFDEELSPEHRRRARLDVMADLTRELGTNDVDVTDLDGVRPEIGVAALQGGVLLVGNSRRADQLQKRFSDRTTEYTRDDRLDRFDDLLTEMEDTVGA